MVEAPKACPKCVQEKAPWASRGTWWWPENGYIYCRHCYATFPLKDLKALVAAEKDRP